MKSIILLSAIVIYIARSHKQDLFDFLKMSRPLFNRNGSWDPLQDWPKSSILNWCRGAPFFLELDDSSWLKTARKTLETSSWPGFRSLSLVTPVCPEVPHSSRDGHVECDPKTWRISLDVSTFCPEEIGVKINAGYLEVVGMSYLSFQEILKASRQMDSY